LAGDGSSQLGCENRWTSTSFFFSLLQGNFFQPRSPFLFYPGFLVPGYFRFFCVMFLVCLPLLMLVPIQLKDAKLSPYTILRLPPPSPGPGLNRNFNLLFFVNSFMQTQFDFPHQDGAALNRFHSLSLWSLRFSCSPYTLRILAVLLDAIQCLLFSRILSNI